VVELLLGKDADVNAQGENYGNALQAASYNGHEKVVELLLNCEAKWQLTLTLYQRRQSDWLSGDRQTG
jgi:Ankyrin repeats (many copies)